MIITFIVVLSPCSRYIREYLYEDHNKGKAVPLQARSGPDFMTTVQDGGKVVSLTHRPPLPPEIHSYSFLLEAESTPGPYCDRKDYVTEKFQ